MTVHSGLTDDFTALDTELDGFSVNDIELFASSPTALALHAALDTLLLESDPTHVPVVVLITDGVPNVDILGNGPVEYDFTEVNPIQLEDGLGGFLPSIDVALLGTENPDLGTWDGEVLANVMDQVDQLALAFPDVQLYSIALQGDPLFNEDFLDYGTSVAGGSNSSALNTDQAVTAMALINAGLSCQ